MRPRQGTLFTGVGADACAAETAADESSSTFVGNMSLPVHRWFRYSAGFSADWASELIRRFRSKSHVTVFDPFAGSATTLLAAETLGVESWGIDTHPFVGRVARAKLAWRSGVDSYREKSKELLKAARRIVPDVSGYPPLIYKCYSEATLADLDRLRRAHSEVADETAASELAWLTIVAILRRTSHVGTAQWQYVLPKKTKRQPMDAFSAFDDCVRMISNDMQLGEECTGPGAVFQSVDARACSTVPDAWANLVITSPPYPNNYDYADATRLEMSFLREISGWGDLQRTVRRHLVRSCSQHVPEKSVDLSQMVDSPELEPIRSELVDVCNRLAQIRETKAGRKTYHLMIACYFRDLANVWKALRRVCADDADVCFVIGDSAPYGVYVPVIPWLGRLAESVGFRSFRFEKIRDRNVKWKNRKHRVPLQEGRLWVKG